MALATKGGETEVHVLNMRNACGSGGGRNKKCVDAAQWLWRPRAAKQRVMQLRNGCDDRGGGAKKMYRNTASAVATKGATKNVLEQRNGCDEQTRRDTYEMI